MYIHYAYMPSSIYTSAAAKEENLKFVMRLVEGDYQ